MPASPIAPEDTFIGVIKEQEKLSLTIVSFLLFGQKAGIEPNGLKTTAKAVFGITELSALT